MEIRANEHEKHIRRSRIMISRILTSYDDEKVFVSELANFFSINPDEYTIRKTIRVKRKNHPQDPFLLVDFQHESQKFSFLNKEVWDKLARIPSDNDFHGITISQDRTQKEREHYKKLKVQADAKNLELASAGNLQQKCVVRGLRLVTIDITPA